MKFFPRVDLLLGGKRLSTASRRILDLFYTETLLMMKRCVGSTIISLKFKLLSVGVLSAHRPSLEFLVVRHRDSSSPGKLKAEGVNQEVVSITLTKPPSLGNVPRTPLSLAETRVSVTFRHSIDWRVACQMTVKAAKWPLKTPHCA